MLVITYIQNFQPTRALKGNISLTNMQNQALPDFQHLFILGFNVYIFLYKEKQHLKSAKWEARTLKSKLVGFDGHIIHRVYIKDQNKVIWVKDLRIFKDITSKLAILLQDFEKKLTFEGIQVLDEQKLSDKSSISKKEKNALKKPLKKPTKVLVGRNKESKTFKEENVSEALPQRQIKSRVSRTIKTTAKKQKGTTPLIAQPTSFLNKN